MITVDIADMGDKDFSDYPDDTIFTMSERAPIGIDPSNGHLVYEDTDPKPENMIEVIIDV